MATSADNEAVERQLDRCLDNLQASLAQATAAAASIKALAPRIAAINALFGQLDSVFQKGRAQSAASAPAPPSYTGPTLVVPDPADRPSAESADGGPSAPIAWPWVSGVASPGSTSEEPDPVRAAPDGHTPGAALVSFRLQFESHPGPLDLRAVDEAVSEHPAVRDVALLDYDGRKASLKVWIDGTARPADVRAVLAEKAPQLFGTANEVSIVALDDVA